MGVGAIRALGSAVERLTRNPIPEVSDGNGLTGHGFVPGLAEVLAQVGRFGNRDDDFDAAVSVSDEGAIQGKPGAIAVVAMTLSAFMGLPWARVRAGW